MILHYYLLDPKFFDLAKEHFSEWHAIDLPNGFRFLGGVHIDEGRARAWEKMLKDYDTVHYSDCILPHPLSNRPLSPAQLAVLGELLNVSSSNVMTMFELSEHMAKQHPLLRVTSF